MNLRDSFTGCPINPFNGISIFDCPEHIHTSPNKMLFNISFSPSSNVMSYGPPAFVVSTYATHFPFLSACVLVALLFQEGLIVTVAFALALPQRQTFSFRCNTMLLPNTVGNFTVAYEILVVTNRQHDNIIFLNLSIIIPAYFF